MYPMNYRSMTTLFALAALLLLAAGCPSRDGGDGGGTAPPGGGDTTAEAAPAGPPFTVTLVLTDLGIGDGAYIREADEALRIQAQAGRIEYLQAGELPGPLVNQADSGDIGMPVEGSDQPGTMTMTEACDLVNLVESTDWLVLSTPALVPHAVARIKDGKLAAGHILVLDDDRATELPADPPVPVWVVEYDTQPMAFLAGVAAASSSNNGQFVIIAAKSDPHAVEFLDAAWAGAKYQTNGAVAAVTTVPIDDVTGLITPETYRAAVTTAQQKMGQAFNANHYILALGRATPAILNAVAKNPINGYIAAGYADYTEVRPARVVGCAVKHPSRALAHIFANLDEANDPGVVADGDGMIRVGLEQEAVGFSGYELYKRYNPDGDDIEAQVQAVMAEILVDELDYRGLIERFNRVEDDPAEPAGDEAAAE